MACALLTGGPARANDVWELGSQGSDDFFTGSNNMPGQGVPQAHDLQGLASAPDVDFLLYPRQARHSYEVRITGNNVRWNQPGFSCAACGTLDLVDFAAVVQPTTQFALGSAVSMRYIDPASGNAMKVRIAGSTSVDFTTNDEYTVQIWDTTYFIPRWNNAGGQVTVLLIQNNHTFHPVTGNIYFYDAAGTLLSTQALNVPGQGLQTVNTASIAPLAGLSGSVTIAHTGGWGGLSGKAVAVEGATGFTFDTLMVPIPD